MPRCWCCRAPHYPMGSALCSRISCRKPPGSPRFFTSVFDPFGAAFWRHAPVSLRSWPLWCCVLAVHARLPSFSGPCGAARCGDECVHVLGHVRCPGESIWSSYGRCAKSWTVPDRRISSFGGIERGSLRSKDNLFPCDPSRPFPPSSHP